ncbi:MAG: asparagine synthase-related protein, partial [Gaiellaceae bacterium]
PTLVFNVPLLQLAARDGVTVMLDGEGGDELFGCSPYLVADLLRRGRRRRALELVRRHPDAGPAPSPRLVQWLVREYGVKGAVPYAVHRAARVLRPAGHYAPDWLTPASAKLYVEGRGEWMWKRAAGPRWWAYLSDVLTVGRECAGTHDFLRRRAQLAGLESRHPWLDELDLVELVLRLPPHLAFDAGLNRPFVRRALAGLVPDAIRLRADKSDFSPLLIGAIASYDRGLVNELLGGRHVEVRAYTRRDALDALLARAPVRQNITWAWQVWRLATTECWLRAQSDPELPRRLLERMAARMS